MPDDLDPNIARLCRALNAFPGVQTFGSCGGHPDPKPGQWPASSWYVKLRLPPAGWAALELLAWAVNTHHRGVGRFPVVLVPVAPPPHLNGFGNLSFAVEGRDGADPDELARLLEDVRGMAGDRPARVSRG